MFDLENDVITEITVREAVSRLSQKQQAAIALRYAGYTQADCGVIFGMTRASIGAIEKRARSILEGLLTNGS